MKTLQNTVKEETKSLNKQSKQLLNLADAFALTGNPVMAQTLYVIADKITTSTENIENEFDKQIRNEFDVTMKSIGDVLSSCVQD